MTTETEEIAATVPAFMFLEESADTCFAVVTTAARAARIQNSITEKQK
jgi:hypothetical protein